MTHAHHDPHTTVVERDGYNAGLLMGLAVVLLLAIVGLALLFTQPWDDDGGTNTSPAIEDVVPGDGGGGVPGENDGSGGGSGGGDGSGGEQPPSGQ